jgi:hypothetical protein
VDKAPLTIVPDSAVMIYGGPVPTFSARYSGLVHGDTAAGISAVSCTSTDGLGQTITSRTPAGTYPIACSGGGGSNYLITSYLTSTLTIKPALLTVTANDQSMTYGGPVPTFDARYGGLVNDDTAGVVRALSCGALDGSGQPVSSSTPAGTYTITCSGGAARNYALSYQPGTLSVRPAPLTITANAQQMTLHGSVPALTVSYSGLANGDTAAALQPGPNCSTTATSSSPVGTYPITCSGSVGANYAISYQSGSLKVLYKWSGFGQPINDPVAGASQMSVFKAGSNVSVKFQLKDASGAVMQAGRLPTFSVSAPQACSAGAVDESVSTATGDTGTTYRWDSTAQQYTYNYKPASTLAGQCQSVKATLDDGTTQGVLIGYK